MSFSERMNNAWLAAINHLMVGAGFLEHQK